MKQSKNLKHIFRHKLDRETFSIIWKYIGRILKFAKKSLKKSIKQADKFFKYTRFCKITSFVIFSIFLLYFFPAFQSQGVIVFWDLDFWFSSESYFSRIFPLWNDIWSSSNFFNSTRIYFVGLSEIFSVFFWDPSGIYQKIVLYLCLQLSFFWMFLLTHKILKTENKKHSPVINPTIIFFISCASGIFYALNPWSIMRIQHLYLLTWYALLPFIFRYIILIWEWVKKQNKKKILKNVILCALFYVFAIWSVHYIVFIFLFIASWYCFYSARILLKKKWKDFFSLTISYFLLWGCISLLMMHWLIPFLWSSLITSQGPENLNTIETLNMFSRFSELHDIVYLTSYWWRMIDTSQFWLLYWIWWSIIIMTIFVINIIHYKNIYSQFFIFWAVLLIILSTGTNWFISETYEYLVFHNPLWATMGSVFRDPNKLVGLLAFCYSILWSLWIYQLISRLLRIRMQVHAENKMLKKISQVKRKKIRPIHKRNIVLKKILLSFSICFISFSTVSYVYYIGPFKNVYIDNFYESIKTPYPYTKLIEYQKSNPQQARAIFLPRYERIQSPWYGFAVSSWNNDPKEEIKKPTGAIDLSTTLTPSYHPLEWVNTAVWYFYDYIESYLRYDKWRNLSKYLDMLNIETLVFHNDILWREQEQAHQLKSIEAQPGIQKEFSSWFMHLFKTQWDIGYHHAFARKAFIIWGLSKLEGVFRYSPIKPSDFAFIFFQQQIPKDHIYTDSDIIVADKKLDIYLSHLNENNLFFPFSESRNYDPYFKWSVLKSHIPDFRWHLKQLGIDNWNWDFDFWKWFIFSYAPASVSIASYNNIYDFWSNLIDLEKYNDISELFTAENDDLQLSLDKKNKGDHFVAVKWNVRNWNDQKSWKVASMLPKSVKEKHPYTLELTLSGVWIKNIHGKVKFLNREWREVWIAYVVAPQYIENFEWIKFRGSFVTPAETSSVLVEILSSQKPQKNTYWWLHDIQFKDLWEYKIPNTLTWNHQIQNAWEYLVFSRAFHSKKWGIIHLKLDKKTFSLDTKTEHKNTFEWNKLGSISVDSAKNIDVEIENIQWFNALNTIALIEKNKWIALQKSVWENALSQAKQMILAESEFDMEYEWNIQSRKYHPYFSNGRAVSLYDWVLSKDFDIFKDSQYTLVFWEHLSDQIQSEIYIDIYRGEKNILNKKISRPSNAPNKIALGQLESWSYNIKIRLQDKKRSLLNSKDISKSQQISDETFQADDEIWCTYHDWLLDEQSIYSYDSQWVNIVLLRGTSCFWLISTHSQPIEIESQKEYFLSYIAEYIHTNKFHSKLKFFDENNVYLEDETIYLYDHGSIKTWRKTKVEKIIEAPKWAKFMQLEFWQKQIQEHKSTQVSIQNIQVRKYTDIPSLDTILIYDNNIQDKGISKSLTYEKVSKMQQLIHEEKNIETQYILQLSESYSPLWQMHNSQWFIAPIIINMFMNWYYIYNTNFADNILIHRSRDMMYLWYIISISAMILLCLSYYLVSFHYLKVCLQSHIFRLKIKNLIKK